MTMASQVSVPGPARCLREKVCQFWDNEWNTFSLAGSTSCLVQQLQAVAGSCKVRPSFSYLPAQPGARPLGGFEYLLQLFHKDRRSILLDSSIYCYSYAAVISRLSSRLTEKQNEAIWSHLQRASSLPGKLVASPCECGSSTLPYLQQRGLGPSEWKPRSREQTWLQNGFKI